MRTFELIYLTAVTPACCLLMSWAASVRVASPAVAEPVWVRYAWANNPEGCNLYNKAGLPAAPFWVSVTGVRLDGEPAE